MQGFERPSELSWRSLARALVFALPVALMFAACSSKTTTSEPTAGGSADLKGGIPAHSQADAGSAGHGHGHAGHGGGGMHDRDGAVDEDSDASADESTESGDTDDTADETDEAPEAPEAPEMGTGAPRAEQRCAARCADRCAYAGEANRSSLAYAFCLRLFPIATFRERGLDRA